MISTDLGTLYLLLVLWFAIGLALHLFWNWNAKSYPVEELLMCTVFGGILTPLHFYLKSQYKDVSVEIYGLGLGINKDSYEFDQGTLKFLNVYYGFLKITYSSYIENEDYFKHN